MPILALLRLLPGIGRMLTGLSGWLMRRKWGMWLMFYLGGAVWRWIEKLITFAGVLFVANEWAAPALMAYITGPLLSMPEHWQQLMGLTRVDQAISIIMSAVVVRAASSIRIQRNPQAPNWTTSPGASG